MQSYREFLSRLHKAIDQTKDRQVLLAIVGLVLGTMCWGGNSVAGRLSVGDIPPIALSFWRWTCAFIILLTISGVDVWRLRGQIWQHKKQLIPLALLSITSFNTLLYLSAQSTLAVNIALIQTALPVFAITLSIPLLNEKPTKYQLLGGAIAIPGLLLIFSQGQLNNLLALRFGKGDLIMFFAVLCWGLYTVLLRRYHLPFKGIPLLTVLVGLGVTMLFPVYLWEYSIKGGFELNLKSIGLLSYVVLFASLVAYLCWNNGVRVLGASKASMFNFLIPIFAATFAIPVLGEPLHSYHLLAALFIFTGLWLTTKSTQ